LVGAGALNEVVLTTEACVVDVLGTGRVNDAISVSACCVEGDLLETRVGVAGLNDQDVTQLAGAS
jgi:stage V sporulation protein SpoVS